MLNPLVLSRSLQFQEHRIDSLDDPPKVEEGSSGIMACVWTDYLIKSHPSIH
jgi:hypothetical protein